jgi:hypothetical protein
LISPSPDEGGYQGKDVIVLWRRVGAHSMVKDLPSFTATENKSCTLKLSGVMLPEPWKNWFYVLM